MSDPAYAPDPADELAQFAAASKSSEDFWLVYRTLMARYDSSCRVAHMTTFADEVAALAVSALAATRRLADPEAETVWAWDCGEKPYPHPHVGPESWVRQIAPLHWPNGRAIRRSVSPWLPAPTNTEES